jgi:hypothetical protein
MEGVDNIKLNKLKSLYKGKCPSCKNKIIKSIDNGSAIRLYEYIKSKWVNTDNNPTNDQIATIYYCLSCPYERIVKEIDIN